MNDRNQRAGQLLKAAIEEGMARAPDALLPKEEAWQNIIDALEQQEAPKERRKPFRRFWKPLGIVVAAASLLFIVFMLPQTGSAFNWFKNLVLKPEGDGVSLFTSFGSDESDEDIEIVGESEEVRTKSLERAKKMTSFQIRLPQYMPDGYKLHEIMLDVIPGVKSDSVTLYYRKGKNTLEIRQEYSGEGAGTYYFNGSKTKSKIVRIHSEKGALVEQENGAVNLVWLANKVSFDMSGYLPPMEMIRIAESLRP
ncbi:DUF4367 domain-containing protein [Numidum massiliense]|uniref:DUF4367 domain-containing protein n=1 Tax=Numidum massiliense TaxID=1522315 RepID=UPI0006D54EDD|nr:DUF4367 domain-containing protein [Numidum massiliense]